MLFQPRSFLKSSVWFDPDPDAGGGNGGGEGSANNKPEAKTYSQEELDALFSERAKRASSSARTDLLKALGFASEDEAKAAVEEAKKLKQSQMTETEKAKADAETAKKEAETAKAEAQQAVTAANERVMRSEVKAAAREAGFNSDALDDVWLFVDKAKIVQKEDGSFTGVKEAVDVVAKAKPWMLGEATDKKKGKGTPNLKNRQSVNNTQKGENDEGYQRTDHRPLRL